MTTELSKAAETAFPARLSEDSTNPKALQPLESLRSSDTVASPLLTVEDLNRRYGLYRQRVFALCVAGLLHPVQVRPGARKLYAQWEVEQALATRPLGLQVTAPAASSPLLASSNSSAVGGADPTKAS